MHVLMIGVDKSTKGGMWTVVENYLNNKDFVNRNCLVYIPTSITGCSLIRKLCFTIKAYVSIYNTIRNNKIDILHVHMSERASIYRKGLVMKYAKCHGIKIILHMHGAEFETLFEKMLYPERIVVKRIINLADKVIILGNYWKSFIGSLLTSRNKLVVVYNAVNVPVKYMYDATSNRILFLGTMSKRKGIDVFLASLKDVEYDISSKCTVDLYGPDVDGTIEDKILRYGLNSWVHYRGWVSNENKLNVLSHTMINVLPSFNEGLPMTILEAMSYGVPTISTKIAAIPEAVTSENGIIISPNNVYELSYALKDLIFNDEKRLKLSKKAYEDALDKFSVELHISKIQKIYEDVLA